MAFTKIENSTPVKEFPGIYNGNIDQLISEIDELKATIDAKESRIRDLENYINRLQDTLEGRITQRFDERFIVIENRISAIESKLKD